jgi:transposase
MKNPTQRLIAEVPRRSSKVGMTIGIDLGDVWSHYCTLNEDGEVVGRGRFRTSPSGVEKWVRELRAISHSDRKSDQVGCGEAGSIRAARFTDLPRVRIAMEAGTHSIWISEQLEELGHEVIVANGQRRQYFGELRKWADEVCNTMSEAVHACDLNPQNMEAGQFYMVRHELLHKLSAQS